MRVDPPRFVAPQAWVNGAWASEVVLSVAADGTWLQVEPNAGEQARHGATRLAGPVLPGLVNGHSHAFQRAIAGLTERASATDDNFWSWRDRMYSAANRITPDQLEVIAAQLYAELLGNGYTQVCEFHYLHNDPGGRPYADPVEMSLALVRAATRVGMGLTLLPTLYMRSGFGATGLRDDQRRFASTPDSVLRMAESISRQSGEARVRTGVALHSLRAVDEAALREVAAAAAGRMPIHLHIAEQQQEVVDCLAHHGQRPIDWLLGQVALDAGWNLVHATDASAAELAGVQASGAAIVICPSTEANLGDGVFDLPTWMGRGGHWLIGSDSHVTRCWQEEVRLLEYSQRLSLRRRNIAATATGPIQGGSSAAALFQGALQGGSAAAGLPLGGLAAGQRADFMVIDTDAPAVLGVPTDHLLDALVFSSPGAQPAQVYVAGKPVAKTDTSAAFVSAMQALWR